LPPPECHDLGWRYSGLGVSAKCGYVRFVETAAIKGQTIHPTAAPIGKPSASAKLGGVSWERMIRDVEKVR